MSRTDEIRERWNLVGSPTLRNLTFKDLSSNLNYPERWIRLMSLRVLLIINAIVLGASGLLAILFPENVLSLYGVSPGPAVNLMSQYAGLGSIAISLVCWLGRYTKEANARKTLIPALLITHLIGILISVLGTISGVMKIGGVVVGIYLVFALGYAYFQFIRKDEL